MTRHTTCNFSDNENFVVLECVTRLLDKGYRPKHIELEKARMLGREAIIWPENLLILCYADAGIQYRMSIMYRLVHIMAAECISFLITGDLCGILVCVWTVG